MCDLLHCAQCGKPAIMLDREGKRLHAYQWVVTCSSCGYSPGDWVNREVDAAYLWNTHIPVTEMAFMM